MEYQNEEKGNSVMVSMKDIANACGVSVATVSKALSDRLDIGIETKTLVRQKALEMGYLPNTQARALRTNRTYNIGVLFVEGTNSGLTHEYFIGIINSFKYLAEEKGYDITFVNRLNNSYLEHSRSRRFDGIMVACIDFHNSEILELAESEIPLVTIDYILPNRTGIVSDNAKAMRSLVEYIYSQGHRKIAYIYGEDSAVTRLRVDSIYKVAKEKELEIPDTYVREAKYRDVSLAGRITEELLDLPEPPTCIIYPDDYAALGGIDAIRNRGLRIPDDISIAGYDGIPILSQLKPQMTTIKQNTKVIGEMAAEKLIELIEYPERKEIMTVTVKSQLIKGGTVAKIIAES